MEGKEWEIGAVDAVSLRNPHAFLHHLLIAVRHTAALVPDETVRETERGWGRERDEREMISVGHEQPEILHAYTAAVIHNVGKENHTQNSSQVHNNVHNVTKASKMPCTRGNI